MADDLFQAAQKAMQNSHAPYSQFPVGAALRTKNGHIYSGCNVENASFPEGWCAETSAIAQMVSAGEYKITEIAVVAEKQVKITPCGGCRQRIAEFADKSTKIYLCDASGIVEMRLITELLPDYFML